MTLNELPVGKAAVITKVGGAGALRCYTLTIRIEDAKNIEVKEGEPA